MNIHTVAAIAVVTASLVGAVGRLRAWKHIYRLQQDFQLMLKIVREWTDAESSPELHERLRPFFQQYDTEHRKYGFPENRSQSV